MANSSGIPSENIFDPLLKYTKIITFDWDLSRDTISLSPNALDMLGIASCRRSKYSMFVNMHPEDRAAHRARVEKAIKTGGHYASEFRYIRPADKKILTLESHGRVQPAAAGKAARIQGFALDISERAAAEQALRKKQEELRFILDAMPAMIWYKDRKNRVLRCNEVVARSLGLKISQVEGRRVEDLYPAQAAQYHADDKEVLASGHPKLGILEALETAKGRRWIETDKFPHRDEKGEIIGLIVFSKDITERRQAEEVLRRSERLQREFVAHVSHEFRTPVTAIKGFAETLRKGALDDKKNRATFVRIIESHADRLSWLIEDLLALSALDSSEAKLETETIALAKFLTDYVVSVGSLTRARGMTIRVDIPAALMVCADAPRLLQIVENLIGNSIKYGRRAGWIVVSARSKGGWVTVEVADDGPGIPRALLPRIFDPFFKIARKTGAGTGLGLHIVKKIVEAHGGKVWAESREGRGAVFSFTVRAQKR